MSFVSRNHPQQVKSRGALDQVDDRGTPWEVFQPISDRFGGFTVDAAAAEHNAKCLRFWTLADDGLSQSWSGEKVWCNPPYSDLAAWLAKARSSARDAELIVMLVPANRTEQGWWQDHVEPFRDGRSPTGPRTEFWRGRTRFVRPGQTEIGANERPPFGCALLIWDCGTVVRPGGTRTTNTGTRQTGGGQPSNGAQDKENRTMQLQNFQPKARITGDKMDLRNYYGRPLLVRVNEYVTDFTSQKYPNPKQVVFVDVVDLVSGSIFINALWGGGAVVDNLAEYAGTEVVLPLVANEAQGATNKYISLAALDDNTAAMAAQWANANWGVVEQTRQQRMAAAQAAQPPVQQAPQNQFQQQPAAQPGFAPIGVQGQQQAPQQGFGQPAQQGQFQQQPAAQPPMQQGQGFAPAGGGQPMQGFGQPAAQQPPAQQGWAPPAQAPAQQPGMFSDAQPPMQQGQGFGAPQGGVDQAAAQAALQQLNGQIG